MNKKYYLFGLLSALIIPVLFFIHIVKADGEYIAFIKDTNRDEGTITVDITLPFFLNFIGNGDQYANGDDLSKISYNGANPISAIRINNQLITATFDIDQMGTGKTGGDFVMASGLFGTDGLGTPNNEIIIDDNYMQVLRNFLLHRMQFLHHLFQRLDNNRSYHIQMLLHQDQTSLHPDLPKQY